MPRPRVTFSRNGTTSSGFSGPPKDTTSRASYGAVAAVDGEPGPGDPGREPHGLLLRRRRRVGVVRDGQRGRGGAAGPPGGPARPEPGPRPGHLGLGGGTG